MNEFFIFDKNRKFFQKRIWKSYYIQAVCAGIDVTINKRRDWPDLYGVASPRPYKIVRNPNFPVGAFHGPDHAGYRFSE